MANFYYNPGRKEDIITQWNDYLQQESYVKDIKQIITKNSNEIRDAVKNGSAEQVEAINNVVGQLEDLNYVMDEMNNNLLDINSNISELRGEINAMASMLDWKMSQMIEEQRITNQLLGHIANLLRIPDSQKQRVYYIEQGIKYLKNAFMENDVNSSFYLDAFEELKKAESIERKDYITLNRIGQIHLYSKQHYDFNKAEEYFLKSARESLAEANVNGTTVSNNLSPNGYETNIYSDNPFIAATAESYLYAGRACYLQRKLDTAANYAQKAFELVPHFLQAGFDQAKYLAANNKVEEAVKILDKIISNDRNFSKKVILDEDLSTKNEINNFLIYLKDMSHEKAKKKYDDLMKIKGEKSNAEHILSKIKKYLDINSFLSNMRALDMLNSTYDLKYIDYRVVDYTIFKDYSTDIELSLKEFLTKENISKLVLPRLKEELEKKKNKEIKDYIKEKVIEAVFLSVIVLVVLLVLPLIFSGLPFSVFITTVLGGAIISGILGGIYGLIKQPRINIKIVDYTI